MDLIEIETMLRQAIKTENWDMVKKAEKELFRGDVLNHLPFYDWEAKDSDLRRFFKNPNRTKIDFINLFYYGTIGQKDFLNANFDRTDEMIDILYEWLKEYDDKKERERISLDEFWDSEEKLAIHCDTEEKANKLLREFNKTGKKWSSGDDYTKFNCWKSHKKDTCYCNGRGYSSIDYYKINGYKIYEFEDVDLDN